MKAIYLSLFTVLMLSMMSCKKCTTKKNVQMECVSIMVGNGGGFAGSYKEYKVEAGQLYKRSYRHIHEAKTQFELVKKLDTDQIIKLNEYIKALDALDKDYSFQQTGNMTSYLHYKKSSDSKVVVYSWKSNEIGPKQEITALYNHIHTLLISEKE